MGEGAVPHGGQMGIDRNLPEVGHQAGELAHLLETYARIQTIENFGDGRHLGQVGDAGALAQAVHAGVDDVGPALERGEEGSRAQAEVVVGVDGDPGVGDDLLHLADVVLVDRGDDGSADVVEPDDVGPRVRQGAADVQQALQLQAREIHEQAADARALPLGVAHGLAGLGQGLLAADLHLAHGLVEAEVVVGDGERHADDVRPALDAVVHLVAAGLGVEGRGRVDKHLDLERQPERLDLLHLVGIVVVHLHHGDPRLGQLLGDEDDLLLAQVDPLVLPSLAQGEVADRDLLGEGHLRADGIGEVVRADRPPIGLMPWRHVRPPDHSG